MQNDIPAFPSTNEVRVDQFMTAGHAGMTLRDYFAAKAMQAIMSSPERVEGMCVRVGKTIDDAAECIATASYEIADRMLAARAGGEK